MSLKAYSDLIGIDYGVLLHKFEQPYPKNIATFLDTQAY
jgi:hypothetical protein